MDSVHLAMRAYKMLAKESGDLKSWAELDSGIKQLWVHAVELSHGITKMDPPPDCDSPSDSDCNPVETGS